MVMIFVIWSYNGNLPTTEVLLYFPRIRPLILKVRWAAKFLKFSKVLHDPVDFWPGSYSNTNIIQQNVIILSYSISTFCDVIGIQGFLVELINIEPVSLQFMVLIICFFFKISVEVFTQMILADTPFLFIINSFVQTIKNGVFNNSFLSLR